MPNMNQFNTPDALTQWTLITTLWSTVPFLSLLYRWGNRHTPMVSNLSKTRGPVRGRVRVWTTHIPAPRSEAIIKTTTERVRYSARSANIQLRGPATGSQDFVSPRGRSHDVTRQVPSHLSFLCWAVGKHEAAHLPGIRSSEGSFR